jgi:DNA-directed RNA polymerase subunit RPC12/RpoP
MFGQSIGHSLQYFCLECGNELISSRRLIDIGGCHTSQECLKCGYTLLFGTIKKK